MIQCICIDDKNRPNEIPIMKWVVKGRKYTISHIFSMVNQKGIQGCSLKEISLDGCEPYECFRLSRFAFREEDLSALFELMSLCTELSDIDIKKELEELQLQEN